MNFRCVALLSFGVCFGLGGPGLAGTFAKVEQPGLPVTAQNHVVGVASTQATTTAKKKKPTATTAKSTKKKPTAAELAAKAKAEQQKKLQAAAKAKAAEKARLAAKAKADREKKMAAAKAERERLIAERKKIEAERQLARAKAAEQKKLARLKAAEQKRLAAQARQEAAKRTRLAKLQAEEQRRRATADAAAAARQAEIARLASMDVVRTGNNGELRSESRPLPKETGLFAGLFGGEVQRQSMLPQTRALDAVLEQRQAAKKFQVRPEFEPQVVQFSGYPVGTIVIDTRSRHLYLMETSSRARRYAIAVGREGLEFKGRGKIGDKQEWPRWIPTLAMQQREPHKYAQYKNGMPGGPDNPLGARAMYVHQGGKDTHIRIHGTNAPETIGTNSSNGCFRMINDHVIDLYQRVKVGADVVVL